MNDLRSLPAILSGAAVLGLATAWSPSAFADQPIQYQVTSLGTFVPVAINAAGVIVGSYTTGTGPGAVTHPATYTNGTTKDLGSLGGTYGVAQGINAQGDVVGYSSTGGGSPEMHAFLYTGGVMHDLGTLGGSYSAASAVNSAGTIAGSSYSTGAQTTTAFRYAGGTLTGLGTFGGTTSAASAISSSGQIVGYAYTAANVEHAFLCASGTSLQDLGTLGGSASHANAIDDQGDIVGQSDTSTTTGSGNPIQRAFTYSGSGPMMDLGSLDGGSSDARGMNNHGQVVGVSYSLADFTPHAFLESGGSMADLNVLATNLTAAGFSSLEYASAINDGGLIIGNGQNSLGSFVGFLATPLNGNPPVLVAAKGDPAPGVNGAVLSVAGAPIIDGTGNVAFQALFKGATSATHFTAANQSGIFLYSSAAPVALALTGPDHPDSVTGATFTRLGNPIVGSGGNFLAYPASFKAGTGDATRANATGVWLYQAGTTSLQARAGEALGSSGALLGPIHQLALDSAGDLLFTNLPTGVVPKETVPAFIVADESSHLTPVVKAGDEFFTGTSSAKVKTIVGLVPRKGVAGQSRTFAGSGNYIVELNLAYAATAHQAPGQLILEGTVANQMNSFSNVAITGTQGIGKVPGLPMAQFLSLGEPIGNAEGDLAFTATLTGTGVTRENRAALLVEESGGILTLPHRQGDPAPDASGTATTAEFAAFGDPVLDSTGEIAFLATLQTGEGVSAKNNSGIWSDAGGTFALVARKGDLAPGSTGTFLSFSQLVLPDTGGPTFVAKLKGVPASQNTGLWVTTPSGLALVVKTGDKLTVNAAEKMVKTLTIFPSVPGELGQGRSFDPVSGKLVFEVVFTDHTWAIFKWSPE